MTAFAKNHFGAGETLFQGAAKGLCLFLRGVQPTEYNQDIGRSGIQLSGQFQSRLQALRSGCQDVFPAKADVISRTGLRGVADDTGNEPRLNGSGGFREGGNQLFRGHFRVQIGQGEIAFSQGVGGNHLHLGILIQGRRLLGGEDDVAVIGED